MPIGQGTTSKGCLHSTTPDLQREPRSLQLCRMLETSRSAKYRHNGTASQCTSFRPGQSQWYVLKSPHAPENPLTRLQIVLSILVWAMVVTRRREAPIFGKRAYSYHDSLLDNGSPADSSDDLLWFDTVSNEDTLDSIASSKHPPKRRKVCGCTMNTPNTSQFANNIHSRTLYKYPFLIEMFYWIITYLFYRMTKVISQRIFSQEIWDVAQAHGLQILDFEQFGPLSFLFPMKEHSVQFWFMEGHQKALTILNRAYALIHIPGTVGYDIPISVYSNAHRY